MSIREQLRAPARQGCSPNSPADCKIHTRQPLPRQKRFRIKGGRGDEALRIGDFLILKNAKHPIQRSRKADPEIVSPRQLFGYLLSAQKVTYKNNKEIATLRAAQFAAAPQRRTATRRSSFRPPPSANSSPRPPQTEKTAKKCTLFVGYCNYLYYFWTKRSVEKDVNRVAVS